MVHTAGGIQPLAYAEMDSPELLDEWFELDMARGTRQMELILSAKPEYVFFGGSGTITMASPDLAMKYAIPALKKWSGLCHQAGIPSLIHSCGKNRILVDMLVEHTYVSCINPLEIAPMGDIDLAEVKKARGRQIALMGNLHTTAVMLRGTPTDVEQACIQAMREAGPGGGFILSTGDQCPRDTPEENIFAMVEAAKKYGAYDPVTGRLPNLPPNGR
jgi:uroporphyrinogen decarboxylase